MLRARVEYLVQHDSLSFAKARQQAQKEVLAIFDFSIPEVKTFESLDLTNDAVLLAVSCILQGLLSTGEMAEFMANIITDIRTDGILDNTELKAKLIDNAIFVPLSSVREKMTSKYASLGLNVSIPDFESYIKSFIGDNTSPSASVSYPKTGFLYGGINILSDEVTSVKKVNNNGEPFYSMCADVPRGLSLKIIIRNGPDMDSGGSWVYWASPDHPVNWRVSLYDSKKQCQEFTILEYEIQNDLKIQFATQNFTGNPQYILIEYYENASETPTKVKRVYLEEPDDIDDTEFCKYLNMKDINKTIPIINDFLAGHPDGISMEQIYEALVTRLNSYTCNLNARILYGEHIDWGYEVMRGVAFSIIDNGITRDLELDFAPIDNMHYRVQIVGYAYYKQDVVNVKTKYTDINKVFDFINSLDLDVQEIQYGTYLSSMDANQDILQIVINNLKAKPYITDSWVTGHLGWYNANFVIFLNLYDMHNKDYQADWIKTMSEYKFKNYAEGPEHLVVFYIPEETGKQWETKFAGYDFVDWAELSYTRHSIR